MAREPLSCDMSGSEKESGTADVKITKEDLLEELRRISDLVGGTPTAGEIRDHSKYSASTYYSRFDGIIDAREQAGVGDGKVEDYVKITDEQLLDGIRRLENKLNRPPSSTEIDSMGEYCPDTYTQRFGSISAAREQAGIEAEFDFHSEKLSKERLKRVCDYCGKTEYVWPSRADQKYCSNECSGRARRKAETADVRSALEELADSLGRAPTRKEFKSNTNVPFVFGCRDDLDNFSAEIRKIGYQPRCPQDLSEEDLLNELRALYRKHDRAPRQEDVISDGLVNSVGPYISRWGSWIKALKAAGISPTGTQYRELEEDMLIAEFQRVADEIGTPPSYTDISERAEYSAGAYENKFGTFLQAKNAAGFDPEPSRHNLPVGEEHYAWKGGVNPQYGPNWREQRKKARQRDDYKCQRCGLEKADHLDEYGTLPHVHHIVPWDEFDDHKERNDLENLITLCASCHKKVESLPVRPQFHTA